MDHKTVLIEYFFAGPLKILKTAKHNFHKGKDWSFVSVDGSLPDRFAIYKALKKFKDEFKENNGFDVDNVKFTRVEIMSDSQQSAYKHNYWDKEPDMYTREEINREE